MKLRRFKHYKLAVFFLVLAVSSPTYVVGQDKISFQGEVSRIEGRRIQVTLQGGQSMWVTTSQDITRFTVGQIITGTYTPVGDSMLATDLIIKPKSQ